MITIPFGNCFKKNQGNVFSGQATEDSNLYRLAIFPKLYSLEPVCLISMGAPLLQQGNNKKPPEIRGHWFIDSDGITA